MADRDPLLTMPEVPSARALAAVATPRMATLPPPSADRVSRPTPVPASAAQPHEVGEDATSIDDEGRIVLRLHSRSGRLVATYAIGAGRSAVLARRLLRQRDSAASLHDATHVTIAPPAPEPPIGDGEPAAVVIDVRRRKPYQPMSNAWMLAIMVTLAVMTGTCVGVAARAAGLNVNVTTKGTP